MADFKRLIAGVGCKDGQTVLLETIRDEKRTAANIPLLDMAHFCNNNGADGLLVFDLSETDTEHEQTIGLIKEAAGSVDIPIFAGGRIKRLEDVKKYLYAGAKAVFLDGAKEEHIDLIKEAADRFGGEKIFVTVSKEAQFQRADEFAQLGASTLLVADEAVQTFFDGLKNIPENLKLLFMSADHPTNNTDELLRLMSARQSAGVILTKPVGNDGGYLDFKQSLSKKGVEADVLKSSVPWSEFKKGAEGLVPVIVQDYKTSEVLMLAYMNEQAFSDTLLTGRMHYYSRSRKEQWLKGETSGHYQYVKSLHLDCDKDTILARVHQIGAACHTGAKSCFFTSLAQKECRETNPLKVFEDVFAVIKDRKENPKEGSYTNYLFDKGIDKILKKVGEEATEIIIAAKNPDPEEIKYEISDFLYHIMVLMAERGVSWEDITQELARR